MKKNKHANKKNKNVLNNLERIVNQKANPHFNKKSKVENYEKDNLIEKQNKQKFKSKIDNINTLNEFDDLVSLTNKKYEIINEQDAINQIGEIKITPLNQGNSQIINSALKNTDFNLNKKTNEFLSIPKRPKYEKGMSKENYHKLEKENFLIWRKNLADLEMKNLDRAITPFEKNLEVWKQLWIVVEKSEILFQIVDGRNPLYFYCNDLDNYIKEVDNNKKSILIINKADLMSKEIRKSWLEYFEEKNIKIIFFSALEELNKMDSNENIILDNNNNKINDSEEENKYKILNRNELIKFILTETQNLPKQNNYHIIGFIGYPNVGKSSIINVLMKSKKVAVANLPGKTKHYQTLFLPPDSSLNISEKSLCLMDCPGLVFPSFTASKADMLINGIFRIDTLTDYLSPIQLIIQQIPSKILSKFYKIDLPDIYSAKQFLQILAIRKGYFLYDNVPDEAKTSKIVLKDYVAGKLLFCYLRPDYTKEKFGYIKQYGGDISLNETEIENQKMIQEIPKDFDDNYEKLYMENEDILKDKKVKGDDIDTKFFNDIKKKEDILLENESKPLSKEMRRELKFAVKRGDLDEEEIEDIMSVADYMKVMENIEKKKELTKGKKLIETKKVNF